jgi:hypothetical protein
MLVSSVDFVKSPALYLDKATVEPITITNDGREIAVLTKPSDTPVTDSLLGLLSGLDIRNSDDIKAMRMKL